MAPVKLDDIRKIIQEENQKLLDQVEKKWEQIEARLVDLEEQNSKRSANEYKSMMNDMNIDSRFRNIVIEGINPGDYDDNKRDQEVFRILNHIMGTNCKEHDIDFICDKLGSDDKNRVIVGFTTFRKKLQVLKAKKHLRKVGRIKIYDDLTPEERERRQKLMPVMREARKDNKFAIFRRDKLYINGVEWKRKDEVFKNTDKTTVEEALAHVLPVCQTGIAIVSNVKRSTERQGFTPDFELLNAVESGAKIIPLSSKTNQVALGEESDKIELLQSDKEARLECREVQGQEITLYTYNCRELSSSERAVTLVEMSRNFKWDVIGLSDVRRTREAVLNIGDVEMYLNDSESSGGTGIVVNNRSATNIKFYKAYSHRILKMIWKFNTGGGRIKILQVNAPAENENDSVLEDFYSHLQLALKENYCKYVFIMGSWKCVVGHGADLPQVGEFGLGTRNVRGDRLVRFVEENNLFIMNTFYQKNKEKKWTWSSANGRRKQQLDYFICNNKNIILDVETDNTLNMGSDHVALKIKIRFKPKQSNRPEKSIAF